MKIGLKILVSLSVVWILWNLLIVGDMYLKGQYSDLTLPAAFLTFLILSVAGLAGLGFLYLIAVSVYGWRRDRKAGRLLDAIEKKA